MYGSLQQEGKFFEISEREINNVDPSRWVPDVSVEIGSSVNEQANNAQGFQKENTKCPANEIFLVIDDGNEFKEYDDTPRPRSRSRIKTQEVTFVEKLVYKAAGKVFVIFQVFSRNEMTKHLQDTMSLAQLIPCIKVNQHCLDHIEFQCLF